MEKVIRHLEDLNAKLDDAFREMQGPAVWNDLQNRAERNSGDYYDDGTCKGNNFWQNMKVPLCQACGFPWKLHVCTLCHKHERTNTSRCSGCRK